jgi:flagellar biosynthesis protein FlhF
LEARHERQKIYSPTSSREAWRLVREALGPDAVILSNRTVDGGVEILALANDDMASLAMAAPAVRERSGPSRLAPAFADVPQTNLPRARPARKR